MHDKLLEESPTLDKESLKKYDGAKFSAALDGMKDQAEIDRDVKLAHDLDLFNTPTFFINGRIVIGNRPYGYLKKIVEEELKNAGP
jgi:protein-disulfide isomerase